MFIYNFPELKAIMLMKLSMLLRMLIYLDYRQTTGPGMETWFLLVLEQHAK